ncbi:hypothetical protein AURDEDRAFT_112024 [Auricularia subglabra TFB-10046 SS5]|nr:hypothetical protein AURDEDRAFT_112024 [Auricularia subglabra TFB-10046 SS5]
MAVTALAHPPFQLVDKAVFKPRAAGLFDDLLFPHPGVANVDLDSIPHLRQALSTLDLRMRTLADQRSQVETRLASVVALQSPIRKLPREILAVVFAAGVRELDDEDPLFLPRLTLVCRYWRDVAVDTPELWSRIAIDRHGGLERARRRVERSKAVLLDISIDFSSRSTPNSVTDTVSRAMDLLRPETFRWRSFRLSVPHRAPALAALSRCTERAPKLERLVVSVHMPFLDALCPDTASLAAGSAPLFRGHTPRLRDVQLESSPIACAFNAAGGALLRNLRSLRLVGLCGDEAPGVGPLLAVLRACPALEDLSLRNMEDIALQAAYVPSPPIVHLPFLRTASFSFCGVSRVTALLERLCFPALERIEFAHLDNISPALQMLKRQALAAPHPACAPREYAALVAHGRPRPTEPFGLASLRALRIESSLFNELKLMRILRRLRRIQTLELVECEDVSANFLRGLGAPPPGMGHEWILPELSHLVLDGCSGVEWDGIRVLVEQRGAPLSASDVAPLCKLDVSRCSHMGRERVQWLRMYVRDVRCERERAVWTI